MWWWYKYNNFPNKFETRDSLFTHLFSFHYARHYFYGSSNYIPIQYLKLIWHHLKDIKTLKARNHVLLWAVTFLTVTFELVRLLYMLNFYRSWWHASTHQVIYVWQQSNVLIFPITSFCYLRLLNFCYWSTKCTFPGFPLLTESLTWERGRYVEKLLFNKSEWTFTVLYKIFLMIWRLSSGYLSSKFMHFFSFFC